MQRIQICPHSLALFFFFFLPSFLPPSSSLSVQSSSSSTMNSPSLILATTAMAAVSSTVLFLAFSRQKPHCLDQGPQPPEQILRSCLCSDGKKKERKAKKKKKVRFAADVKEPRGNGDEFRMKMKKIGKSSPVERSCRSEIPGIPANRIALYSGILRDRANRMECSH